jgi:hypothetical protein
MRMLLKIGIPVEKGNEAINSGALQNAMVSTMEALKVEAAYFFPDAQGNRASIFVFDMEGSWQLPAILEPVFQQLGASVHLTPVMNAEDLQRGIKEAGL